MYGYKAQYRRMIEALVLAQREHGDTQKKEDELITFFIHCWHLKDHLQNDPSVNAALRARLVQAVHSAPSLRIAQKIANGTKHYNLTYSVAMRGAHDLTVGPLGGAPQAKTYPRISLPGAKSERAIVLAERAAKQWLAILKKGKLPAT